ncbi:MAG: TIM barrel protein [Clostridiaceae bacterium]
MYNFSILVDDGVAGDLQSKIEICSRLMIGNMEVNDRLDGSCIADCSGEQIENIRNLLIRNNKKIVLLNCGAYVTEQEYYKKIFRKAHLLGIENINVPVGKNDKLDEAFIDGLKSVCEIGASYGIGILLENSSCSFLSTEKDVSQVYKKVRNQCTGLIFNPLEFVRLKRHPFFHMFYNSRLKNDIRFLRVNDGLFLDGNPVFPAKGNAEIKELASILLARGFKGYFSFSPYFKNMNINIYMEVIESFKRLLMEM